MYSVITGLLFATVVFASEIPDATKLQDAKVNKAELLPAKKVKLEFTVYSKLEPKIIEGEVSTPYVLIRNPMVSASHPLRIPDDGVHIGGKDRIQSNFSIAVAPYTDLNALCNAFAGALEYNRLRHLPVKLSYPTRLIWTNHTITGSNKDHEALAKMGRNGKLEFGFYYVNPFLSLRDLTAISDLTCTWIDVR